MSATATLNAPSDAGAHPRGAGTTSDLHPTFGFRETDEIHVVDAEETRRRR